MTSDKRICELSPRGVAAADSKIGAPWTQGTHIAPLTSVFLPAVAATTATCT